MNPIILNISPLMNPNQHLDMDLKYTYLSTHKYTDSGITQPYLKYTITMKHTAH